MDDRTAFIVFYSSLVAMRFHPRNTADIKDKYVVTDILESCADIALEMLQITRVEFDPIYAAERARVER